MELVQKEQQEAPKARTIQDIQAEYAQGCSQAGDLQYRIQCFQEDLDLLNGRLRSLNQEGAALIKAQQEASKPVEESK